MQKGYTDFYENGNGCCLVCPNAYLGCLCYECNCKKCYWYSSPESLYSDKGECDKKYDLIEEKKEKARLWYQLQDEIKNEKYKLLVKDNKKTEEELKKEGIILSHYTCQKCGFCFVSKEEIKIVPNKFPICKLCSGKLNIKETENEK